MTAVENAKKLPVLILITTQINKQLYIITEWEACIYKLDVKCKYGGVSRSKVPRLGSE